MLPSKGVLPDAIAEEREPPEPKPEPKSEKAEVDEPTEPKTYEVPLVCANCRTAGLWTDLQWGMTVEKSFAVNWAKGRRMFCTKCGVAYGGWLYKDGIQAAPAMRWPKR